VAREVFAVKKILWSGIALVLLVGLLFVNTAVAETPDGWDMVGENGLVDGTVVPGSPYSEKPSRNNSYAWSMGTLQCGEDEYLYVGAYRNFPHGAFLGPMSPLGTAIDPSLMGDSLPPFETWDMGTVELMRKNITQDGDWETVDLPPYGAPPGVGDFSGNQGFRKMYNYNDVLYVGTMNMNYPAMGLNGTPRVIAVSNCNDLPVDVTPYVDSGDLEINKAYSYRGMVDHDGVFYAGWEYGIFASTDPLSGWDLLSNEGLEGYVTDLVSYNGSLWAVTADGENGWGLFRWVPEPFVPEPVLDDDDDDYVTPSVVPENGWTTEGSWENETPGLKQNIHVGANGFVYDDHLYIATLNGGFPLYDLDILGASEEQLIERLLKFFVPSYLYRFDGEEKWETVMGGGSGLKAPGFGVPTNVYLWTWGIHDGDLYISTFDWRSFLQAIDWDSIEIVPQNQNVAVDVLKNLVMVHLRAMCEMAGLQLPENPSLSEIVNVFINHGSPVGFDLYKSEDGVNFEVVMQDGFGDPMQYGGRTMATTQEDGKDILWLGTANPGNGCQVWRYEEMPFATETEGFFPDEEGIKYVVSVTPCSEQDNGLVSGDIRMTEEDLSLLFADVPPESESIFFELDLVNPDAVCMVNLCGFFSEEKHEWLPDTQPDLWWHDGVKWNALVVTWTDLGEGEWKACVELPENSWDSLFGAALDESLFMASPQPTPQPTPQPVPGGDDDDDGGSSGGCNVGFAGPVLFLLVPLGMLLFRR